MCGRFSLGIDDPSRLAKQLRAEFLDEHRRRYRARYNVAPTNEHWLLLSDAGKRRLAPATWGFASTTGRFLINARVETASSKPAFRDAWSRRRCIVPADGFYEWTGPARKRQPVWFHPEEGDLLLLAGLYEEARSRDGDATRRFVILTRDADEVVAPIHDRMPVILSPAEIDAWLASPPDAPPLPAKLPLAATYVSQRVNSTANDDPSCIEPAPPPKEQLTLL